MSTRLQKLVIGIVVDLMITLNHQRSDINLQTAINAYCGTSMTPEKRGEHIINDYMAHFDNLTEEFGKWATDDNQADIEADLERYRQGHVKRLLAYLYSHSNVISPFITGPANFPTRRNEKRCRWADNKRDELLAYSDKVLPKLRRKYNPRLIACAPVSSADDNAVAQLQVKIDQATEAQERMKAANKIVRRKISDDEKITKLEEMGFNHGNTLKLLKPSMGQYGFPSFQLTNNNANIRRMKERIEQIKQEQDRPATKQIINGVTVIENKDISRLQLIFDGKPPTEVRSKLKSNGFRWSPREGAWQRLLNNNARYAAKTILETL